MTEWWQILLLVLGSLGVGGTVSWWLTNRFGLEIAHKHRVIEEHAKKVHEYSEKYYMKITGNVEFFESCLREILMQLRESKCPSKQVIELSLFGWARLSKLEEEWFKDTSAALMLTDRTAEGVIVCLHDEIEELLFSKLGCITRENDSILREHIQTYEPLSSFRAKIRKAPLKRIADKYEVAIRRDIETLGSLVDTLCCLERLLYFEVNSCFDAWYAKKTPRPRFENNEWAVIDSALDRLIKKRRIDAKDKEAYLKKIAKTEKKKLTRGNLILNRN